MCSPVCASSHECMINEKELRKRKQNNVYYYILYYILLFLLLSHQGKEKHFDKFNIDMDSSLSDLANKIF